MKIEKITSINGFSCVSDVVVRVSRDGCYLPIPNEMIGSQPWKLLRIPPENVKEGDKFIALTFLPHGKEISSKHLLSFYEEKIKILKHLGYSHVLVRIIIVHISKSFIK